MPREDGFAIADLDPAYFADAKLKRLWRELHDPDLMAKAVVLHLAAIFDSWGAGDRVAVEDSAPMWLDVDPQLRSALETCGLIGRDGKVPQKTWESWFTPAVQRRAARRKGGAKGGRGRGVVAIPEPVPDSSAIAQQLLSNSSAIAQLNPTIHPASPSSPSVITSTPSIPLTRNGARSSKGRNDQEEETTNYISRLRDKLAREDLSPAMRKLAVEELTRLGGLPS